MNLELLYDVTKNNHMPAHMLKVGDVFYHPSKDTKEIMWKVINYKHSTHSGLKVKSVGRKSEINWTLYDSIVVLKK